MAQRVSKRYAINEFNTVGLILIIYCIFVLFLPLAVGELLLEILPETMWHGINLIIASKTLLMIVGTVLPFMLLRLSARKKSVINRKKLPISFKQVLCQTIVFFTATSAAIFAMTALAAYFGISGELVSGIGISIDSDYLTDIVYVITFVVISPLLEEYAFRGVLLNVLSKYGKYFALIASSIIYSLAHGSFMEFIPSFIMGLLLGKIYLRYKSVKPTILIHVIFNLFLYASFIVPESLSIYMAGVYALIYIVAIGLILTRKYKRIIVKKSNSNSKVTLMFLTTFTVLVSIFLFIASSILTILLR